MDHVRYLEIVASIITLYAAYLIAIPKMIGLVIMCVAEMIWMIYCVLTHQYWMFGTNILLIFFNLYGIRRWIQQDVG